MIRSKQDILDTLRRVGAYGLIEGKEDKLPDPVDLDRDRLLLASFGITRESLVDMMGGSP